MSRRRKRVDVHALTDDEVQTLAALFRTMRECGPELRADEQRIADAFIAEAERLPPECGAV